MDNSSKATRSAKGARRVDARRAAGLTLIAILTLATVSMVLDRIPAHIFEGRSEPTPSPEHQYPGTPPRYFGMDPLELYEIYENELSRWEAAEQPANHTTGDETEETEVTGVARSAPTRLKITTIDLDVEVTKSGTDEETLLAAIAAAKEDSPAWYESGPSPGEIGNSVIAGKVADADSEDDESALADLRKLRLGAEIEVEREDGETVRFVVDTVRTCPSTLSAELLDAELDASWLHLVTCGDGDSAQDGVIISASFAEVTASETAEDDAADEAEEPAAEDKDTEEDEEEKEDEEESDD